MNSLVLRWFHALVLLVCLVMPGCGANTSPSRCRIVGDGCGASDDCCSRNCVSGLCKVSTSGASPDLGETCLDNGASCGSAASCCSGTCSAGRCTTPSSCKSNSTSCGGNSECCSGMCLSGACVPKGACNADAQCKGVCVSSTCVDCRTDTECQTRGVCYGAGSATCLGTSDCPYSSKARCMANTCKCNDLNTSCGVQYCAWKYK